jgi:hypothetical protein
MARSAATVSSDQPDPLGPEDLLMRMLKYRRSLSALATTCVVLTGAALPRATVAGVDRSHPDCIADGGTTVDGYYRSLKIVNNCSQDMTVKFCERLPNGSVNQGHRFIPAGETRSILLLEKDTAYDWDAGHGDDVPFPSC